MLFSFAENKAVDTRDRHAAARANEFLIKFTGTIDPEVDIISQSAKLERDSFCFYEEAGGGKNSTVQFACVAKAPFTHRGCLRMLGAIKRTDVISKLCRLESKSSAESLLSPDKGSLRARGLLLPANLTYRERSSIERRGGGGGEERAAFFDRQVMTV